MHKLILLIDVTIWFLSRFYVSAAYPAAAFHTPDFKEDLLRQLNIIMTGLQYSDFARFTLQNNSFYHILSLTLQSTLSETNCFLSLRAKFLLTSQPLQNTRNIMEICPQRQKTRKSIMGQL